jgi:SOS-response transcriptional repressor LexA
MPRRKKRRYYELEKTLEIVYEFIKTHFEEYGYSPSITEIAEATFMSRSSVVRHLDLLEARGRISRDPGVGRSISLNGL